MTLDHQKCGKTGFQPISIVWRAPPTVRSSHADCVRVVPGTLSPEPHNIWLYCPPESNKVYLILHGDDSPIPDWTEAVIRGFNLQVRRIQSLLDDHEQTLHGDGKAITRILGPILTPAEAKVRLTSP
jgi:hypothetical protein